MSQVGEQGAAAIGMEQSCDVERDQEAILVSQVGEQIGGMPRPIHWAIQIR